MPSGGVLKLDIVGTYTYGINQGSKGIRQWLINLCTSLVMIHKFTPYVDLNYWFKRLDT